MNIKYQKFVNIKFDSLTDILTANVAVNYIMQLKPVFLFLIDYACLPNHM